MDFQWWYQDPDEFAVWKKLNSMTPEERKSNKYAPLCKAMVERYGNIYFFKPFPNNQALSCPTVP